MRINHAHCVVGLCLLVSMCAAAFDPFNKPLRLQTISQDIHLDDHQAGLAVDQKCYRLQQQQQHQQQNNICMLVEVLMSTKSASGIKQKKIKKKRLSSGSRPKIYE